MPARHSNSIMMQQLTRSVIVRCSLLLLVGLIQSSHHVGSEARTIENPQGREFFTTNTPAPTAYLENTAEASATSEETDEVDAICYSCHDRVEEAKDMINIHTEMVKKQKAFLGRQRQKKTSQKSSDQQSSKQLRSNDRRDIMDQNDSTTNSQSVSAPAPPQSTISSRTLNDAESRYTVVSRLRVRSTDDHLSGSDRSQAMPKKDKGAILKQMKDNELLHLNETCKALYRVEGCLKEIEEKCLGDLQYHSLESVAEQWITRYKCHQRLTGKKEWTGLIRIAISPKPYTAIPRPISSPEETRIRLHKLLGFDESPSSPRPTVGVMLKPTLTQSASHRFNTIQSSGMQIQAPNTYNRHHPRYTSEGGQFMPLTSQLLLIPCFLVVVIIVITIANYFIRDD